jgi:hypothetical protein
MKAVPAPATVVTNRRREMPAAGVAALSRVLCSLMGEYPYQLEILDRR